jgi:ERCC4-type nuclease
MRGPATRTQALLDGARADSVAALAWTPGAFGIGADTREQILWSFAPSIPVVVKKLDAGDYVLLGAENRCAIERKSLHDFIGSITWERDRFMRELEKLATYDFAAVIVEANVGDVHRRRYRARVEPAVILSTAASIGVRFGLPVFFCGDAHSSADFAVRCFRRFYELKIRPEALAALEADLLRSST